jgi:hypothetical protein
MVPPREFPWYNKIGLVRTNMLSQQKKDEKAQIPGQEGFGNSVMDNRIIQGIVPAAGFSSSCLFAQRGFDHIHTTG